MVFRSHPENFPNQGVRPGLDVTGDTFDVPVTFASSNITPDSDDRSISDGVGTAQWRMSDGISPCYWCNSIWTVVPVDADSNLTVELRCCISGTPNAPSICRRSGWVMSGTSSRSGIPGPSSRTASFTEP